MRHLIVTAALSLALAACGEPKDTAPAADSSAEPSATSETADSRPAAFGQCISCHSVKKDEHGLGPSLFAVYGTKAGEIPGFAFSPAMKASGLTWDDATLDEFLTQPMKKVPGTKMTYAGQGDPAKRKELIEYLKTLK